METLSILFYEHLGKIDLEKVDYHYIYQKTLGSLDQNELTELGNERNNMMISAMIKEAVNPEILIIYKFHLLLNFRSADCERINKLVKSNDNGTVSLYNILFILYILFLNTFI